MKPCSLLLIIMAIALNPKAVERTIKHPEWSQNAAIYEANIRQFSPEGTFAVFEKYLPGLKAMGVKIIWLMPIHPIGILNRKGTLGSYYSVRDYKAINPEFGTKEDFRRLVEKIHGLGMYVIIDWVANHTAWDNVWIATNIEYYDCDSLGNPITEVKDWTDVIDLDYNNPNLRIAMIDAMQYWVEVFDIDGFRCDVAAMVPIDFWEEARQKLEQIKPLFMLAEAHQPELHQKAFDMTYGWRYKDLMNDIAAKRKNVRDLDKYIRRESKIYHPDDYRMLYVTNHDENSWHGTAYERLGEGTEAFIVFTYLFPGMPLIYNGQEAGLNKRLSFFEKDLIPWQEHHNRKLYTILLNLKQTNQALWNGMAGGEFIRLHTSSDCQIFAFARKKSDDKIIAIFNFSDQPKTFKIKSKVLEDEYLNPLTDNALSLSSKNVFKLYKWEYLVLVKQQYDSK
jgi:cyclomaltodextrinase